MTNIYAHKLTSVTHLRFGKYFLLLFIVICSHFVSLCSFVTLCGFFLSLNYVTFQREI